MNDRVDWFTVILDIQRTKKFSLRDIGRKIGMHYSTLITWKQGAEPKYRDGSNLIRLWVKSTGKDESNIPKIK